MNTRSLWKEQCDAARRIRDQFGTNKALTYIVGGKLLSAIRQSPRDHDVHAFADNIRTIFEPEELRTYLQRARSRKHPGKPTDDLIYTPEDTPAIEELKALLLA
jgi:hypothetical protein